jgi:aspartate aminotransferase
LKAVTVQALSGTGALRVGADFMRRFINLPGDNKKKVYVPNPTWGNHIPLYKDAGFEVKYYSYYDEKTCGLNFEGMVKDIEVRTKEKRKKIIPTIHNFLRLQKKK